MKRTSNPQSCVDSSVSELEIHSSITNAPEMPDRLTTRLLQLKQRLKLIEQSVATSLLVALLLIMGSQVIARYVFRSPYSWSEELSRLLMIWMIFMASTFVMAEGGHISVDLWGNRLKRKARLWCDSLVHLLVIGVCLWLLMGGLNFVWSVHPVGSPALGIPKSLWYASVSLGLLMMALHSLLNMTLHVRTGEPNRRWAVRSAEETNLSNSGSAPEIDGRSTENHV